MITRLAKRLVWVSFLVFFGMAGHLEAQTAPPIAFDDPFTGFKFPRQLGSFAFQSHQQYHHVDLGYGVNYVERSAATATIMVYDLNQRGLTNGTSAPAVLEEFANIEAAIQTLSKQSGYRDAMRIETAQLSKAWLQMSHELIRADGRKTYTHSFIRAQNGKFVKIRVSTPNAATFARLPILLLNVSRAIGMLSANDRK